MILGGSGGNRKVYMAMSYILGVIKYLSAMNFCLEVNRGFLTTLEKFFLRQVL